MKALANGRYILKSVVGLGGMGRVWDAEDTMLRRQVAIKEVVAPHGLDDRSRKDLYSRAEHEARNAAKVQHPSLATIYDVVIEDGHPWMIMEFIELPMLSQRVVAEGPLAQDEVIKLAASLLDAVAAVHAADIIHRDIKPSNIAWSAEGSLRLLDFGIAKHAMDTALTGSGMVVGTPSYMAPECILKDAVGPESDLWSVGAVLYFALTGKPIFERSTSQALMYSIAYENIPKLPFKGPLRDVVDGLLQKKASRRLTIDQVRMHLAKANRFAQTETITKSRKQRRRLSSTARRTLAAASTVCGVGALVLALTLFGVIGGDDKQTGGNSTPSTSAASITTSGSSSGSPASSPSSAAASPSPSRSYWLSPNGEVYGDDDMSITLGPGWKVKSTSEHDAAFTSPQGFTYYVEPLGIGNLREVAEKKWADASDEGRTAITYSDNDGYAVWQYSGKAVCTPFPCPSGSTMRFTASIDRQPNGKLVWIVTVGAPSPYSPSASYDQDQREMLADFGKRVELTT